MLVDHEECLSSEQTARVPNILTKVLIPLVDPIRAIPYLELAAALLPCEGKILVLKVVEVPEGESLNVGAEKAPVYRASLEPLESILPGGRVELKTIVRVSREIPAGVAETSSLDVKAIGDGERPPMKTILEYRGNREQVLSSSSAVIH
jgi:hypothetical protein